MARIVNIQCPVFKEAGTIKITTDYEKRQPDYPIDGKTSATPGGGAYLKAEQMVRSSSTLTSNNK